MSYENRLKSRKWNKYLIIAFISVPVLSSFISTVHLVNFFNLGNPFWIATFLAVIFEVASLSSLLTTSVLKYINKTLIYSIFLVTTLMQAIGNVYYSYDYVTMMIVKNPTFLQNFQDLFHGVIGWFFDTVDEKNAKIFLAYLIGIPIPAISLAFSKSLTDYLKSEDENEVEDVKPEAEIDNGPEDNQNEQYITNNDDELETAHMI